MIHRERATEFQKFAFLGRVIGSALGTDSSRLARAEELLASTIFQTMHNPQSMRLSMEKAAQEARKERERRLRDARVLAQTASYSEDDDNIDNSGKASGDLFLQGIKNRRKG